MKNDDIEFFRLLEAGLYRCYGVSFDALNENFHFNPREVKILKQIKIHSRVYKKLSQNFPLEYRKCRKQDIIERYKSGQCTLTEIGKLYGISKQRVYQILQSSDSSCEKQMENM